MGAILALISNGKDKNTFYEELVVDFLDPKGLIAFGKRNQIFVYSFDFLQLSLIGL